jgi:hypothetical protein
MSQCERVFVGHAPVMPENDCRSVKFTGASLLSFTVSMENGVLMDGSGARARVLQRMFELLP